MPTNAPAKRDRRQPAPGYVPVKLLDNMWLLMTPTLDPDTGQLVRLIYIAQEEGRYPDAPRVYRRRADAVRDSHTDYVRRENELLRAELLKLRAQSSTQNILSAVS